MCWLHFKAEQNLATQSCQRWYKRGQGLCQANGTSEFHDRPLSQPEVGEAQVDGCEEQILFISELVLQCGSVASRRLRLFMLGECLSHNPTRNNPSYWFTLSDCMSVFFPSLVSPTTRLDFLARMFVLMGRIR
jgi:hypothetical protein